MQRRTFIKSTLAASLATSATMKALALAENNPFRKKIGIQLYTLRNEIAKDTAGTIKAVADAGYKQVEPYGFPDADEMIKASKDNGMEVNSSHFAWESVTNPSKSGTIPFDVILEKAHSHGLSHLVIPFVHEENRQDLDGYKRLAHNCNVAAQKAKSAGIQLSYHNHCFEFKPYQGGKTGYDVFIEEFSDDMMFEVDVFWVKVGGVDPVDMMKRLEGRVSQLHLKDLKRGSKMPEYDTSNVSKDAFKELGNGIIDMEPIINAAWVAGVDHCHVEQDQSPNPVASIQESMRYLAKL
jgi:sugar phosphate isomerase/epimerase